MASSPPTRMLSDVQALAGTIGPRGTGTSGEAAAAEFVSGRVAALGLPIERQTFPAVPSQNTFALAIDLVALAAVVLYPLGGAIGRWLAAGLALSTAPLLWHTIRYSDNALSGLLPKVTSRSVITRVAPRGEVRQRVVLLAHLDTNRCRMAWQSSTVRSLEPLTYLTLAVFAALGLLYLLGVGLGGPPWLWWLSLLPAAYVLGTVVTLILDDRTPFSPGAHDNAASVAVALEIGSRLAKNARRSSGLAKSARRSSGLAKNARRSSGLATQPLANTEVWLAFTGAEETDHAGLRVLLRQHSSELRKAAFVGLEGVGSGEIVYLTRQGLCAHYRPEPSLLAVAERVAANRPDLAVHGAEMTMEDETGTLRRTGYRAICIAGRDPQTGSLPHWHRPDDTADTVSAATLERAASFVQALLEELDHQVPMQ